MISGHGTEVWASAAWREQAVAWLDERLAATGAHRTGEVEQPHLRPWATALRAATSVGVVWLKAAGPETAFEVRLYDLLQDLAPGRVLAPIAVDTDRGWIVLPDGGPTLRERFDGAELIDALVRFVPQYAQLQRDVQGHEDELAAAGVADMRPAAMPERFEEALAAVRAGAGGLTYARLVQLRPQIASWSEELAAAPGGATLDHNDLHPGNVFLDDAGRARVFDWGDAVVAHPFASMLVGLGWLRDHVDGTTDGDVERVRDAYLEVFTDLAPRDDLLHTLGIAVRLGRIARSLVWQRAIEDADDVPENFAHAPVAWLTTLLRESDA